jgi:hypothetical protein
MSRKVSRFRELPAFLDFDNTQQGDYRNLRDAGYAEGELCGLTGSHVPFAETEAERLSNGDPRPSLEARYGDHQGYVDAVQAAVDKLVAERFLLPSDAVRYMQWAERSSVLQ